MKVTDRVGVIGDFFTDSEEISPGNALARVNKSTSANDFAVVALDSGGSQVNFDEAVEYEFRELTAAQVAAIESNATTDGEQITGVQSGNAWSFETSINGAAAVAIDTGDANRKASTLIDQILEIKTRGAGHAGKALANISEIAWAQSVNKILIAADIAAESLTANKFLTTTASSSSLDFGE